MLFIVFLILGLVSFFVFENFLYVKFFFFLIKDSKLVLSMFFCLIVVILGGDEFLVLVFGLSFFEMFFNFFDIFLRIITDIFDKFCFYLENLLFFFSFGLVCGLGGVRFFVIRSSILFFLFIRRFFDIFLSSFFVIEVKRFLFFFRFFSDFKLKFMELFLGGGGRFGFDLCLFIFLLYYRLFCKYKV